MNLYLVQHAEAENEEEDKNRPITEKGAMDTKKAGEFLAKKKGFELDSIMHSGKLRSQQTADILAVELKPADGCWSADGLAPDADPQIWVNNLRDTNDNVMLVGHLPHLEKLASTLLVHDPAKKVINFANAGIVCLRKSPDGAWGVDFIITPDLLA